MEGSDESVTEELVLIAGDAQVMFDVGGGFLEVERAEIVANGEALVEGLKGGEAEQMGQVGLAEEDEGEGGGGVEVVVEQETELVEDVVGQAVGFVEDEQGVTALASQVGQGGAQLRQEAVEGVSGFDLQGEQDLRVEGGDFEVRIGQVDEGVEVVVEGVDEGAQGGGFVKPI